MPLDVLMPRLDRLMTQGTIAQWLKQDGEKVDKGEPVAVVETEKVTSDIEAPASGVFYRLRPEGVAVPVAEVIALVYLQNEEVRGPPKVEKPPEKVEVVRAVEPPKAAEVERRPLASPLAKRLAEERGVDLAQVVGMGPEGMITREDVLAYAERLVVAEMAKPPPVWGEEEPIPLMGWRRTMAERMARSKHTAAHITTIAEVDMTDLAKLREDLERSGDASKRGISYTAFIVKAVVQALQKYPIINSSLVNDKIALKKYYNIGVAVAREKGLVVPVIHNAERKNLYEISESIRDLAEKARGDELRLEDVRGGTFSITNVGMFGAIMNTPIINPPESAILGVGAIVKRPVVRNDQIVIRSMMYLCLSYDHRIIDGAPAIGFLQEVRRLLEAPSTLLD